MGTQLFEHDRRFDAAEPGAAVFQADQKPENPEIGEGAPRRAVANAPYALGDAADRERVVTESPNGVLQLELIIRETKFHFATTASPW
jgi:hypothetical protein